MGRKVNPKIFRIPLIRDWESKWFAKKNEFKQFLKEDIQIREFLSKRLKNCGVSNVSIERLANIVRVSISTAKPGLIIGRGGLDIEKLKKELKVFVSDKIVLEVNVLEEKKPMLSADVILEGVIADLEKRFPFRRTMKKVIRNAKTSEAKGIKVILSGRLGGVEIARSEKLIWGNLPLHTLRADIDYSRGTAATTYGSVGVKIWVYRGEKFEKTKSNQIKVNLKT